MQFFGLFVSCLSSSNAWEIAWSSSTPLCYLCYRNSHSQLTTYQSGCTFLRCLQAQASAVMIKLATIDGMQLPSQYYNLNAERMKMEQKTFTDLTDSNCVSLSSTLISLQTHTFKLFPLPSANKPSSFFKQNCTRRKHTKLQQYRPCYIVISRVLLLFCDTSDQWYKACSNRNLMQCICSWTA